MLRWGVWGGRTLRGHDVNEVHGHSVYYIRGTVSPAAVIPNVVRNPMSGASEKGIHLCPERVSSLRSIGMTLGGDERRVWESAPYGWDDDTELKNRSEGVVWRRRAITDRPYGGTPRILLRWWAARMGNRF
jgi:hypothetical protein